MRARYLAQDRCDLGESAKALAQEMASPTQPSWDRAKRLARYLLGRPRARLRYRRQTFPNEIRVMEDSDWASCPITRKSISGCMVFVGSHMIKSSSTLQSLTTLSVGESEYYALVKGAVVGISVVSMLSELGLEVELLVESDPSTAESLANRIGVQRTKHMQSRYLWVQERVLAGDLTTRHVPTKSNWSDILTKPVSRLELDRACTVVCLFFW